MACDCVAAWNWPLILNLFSVGKKGPMNGEVNSSSPVTSSSPSQDNADDKKTTGAKDTTNGTANDNEKQRARPFDINDFFLSETLLPFSGGVSLSNPKTLRSIHNLWGVGHEDFVV